MGSRDYSRRDVLRTAGGLATVGAVGLSGCSQLQGSSDDATASEESKKSAGSVTSDVPARSNFVVETDYKALLDDQALRDAVNKALSDGMAASEGVPSSVGGILDRIEKKTDLDPRNLEQTVLFGESSGQREKPKYAGYIVYSSWSAETIRKQLEEADLEDAETESYGGQTVYSSPEDEGSLTVFDDGTIVAGSGGAVTDVIDLRNGTGKALSGDLLTAWNAARDGYVRFAFDVDPKSLPDEQAAMVGSTLENVQYNYGAIYADGDVRGVELTAEFDSAESAEKAVGVIENALLMAASRAESEQTSQFIEGITVTAEGSTVTLRNEVPVSEITQAVQELVTYFVTRRTSSYGSTTETTTA